MKSKRFQVDSDDDDEPVGGAPTVMAQAAPGSGFRSILHKKTCLEVSSSSFQELLESSKVRSQRPLRSLIQMEDNSDSEEHIHSFAHSHAQVDASARALGQKAEARQTSKDALKRGEDMGIVADFNRRSKTYAIEVKDGCSVLKRKEPHARSSGVRSSSSSHPLPLLEIVVPAFTTPTRNSDESLTLVGDATIRDHQVHRHAAKFLYHHQVEGVRWLWDKYREKKGCILGQVNAYYSPLLW